MQAHFSTRFAAVALLAGGLACAGNKARTEGDTATARDSATAAGVRSGMSDSAKANQAENGVVDAKTGKSTLGPGVTRTKPDQGQPVTAKGDTLRTGGDTTGGSTTTGPGMRSSTDSMGGMRHRPDSTSGQKTIPR